MHFEVSKEAADWYKSEMDLEEGDFVQYYVQLYGGIPTSHPNYSLGMSVGEEGAIAVKDVVEGITFYFNEDNVWFLNEFDMKVDVKNNDLDFIFTEK